MMRWSEMSDEGKRPERQVANDVDEDLQRLKSFGMKSSSWAKSVHSKTLGVMCSRKCTLK